MIFIKTVYAIILFYTTQNCFLSHKRTISDKLLILAKFFHCSKESIVLEKGLCTFALTIPITGFQTSQSESSPYI